VFLSKFLELLLGRFERFTCIVKLNLQAPDFSSLLGVLLRGLLSGARQGRGLSVLGFFELGDFLLKRFVLLAELDQFFSELVDSHFALFQSSLVF